MENTLAKITNEKLLRLCECYGKRTLLWRRKFMGLLPEVQRRRLYEKRGCSSVFEFAAKLAGLSEEQVRLVLRLEKRFENKPALHEILVEGQASLSKLARVASLANSQNEMELAEKVRLLSQKALETLVRDERDFRNGNGSSQPLFEVGPVRTHALDFAVSEEVAEELNRLHKQGQDVNKILLDLLKQRKEKIQEKKDELAEKTLPTDSRYIPVRVKAVLKEEFGQKCSISTCQKPSEEIHHSQRFSLAHMHNPHYLAPLCKEHHQLAHLADLSFRDIRTR